MRPDWDEYFKRIAEVVATRATCPRASMGAVIVSKENRILSTGYNGSPPNEPHCLEVGCLMEDDHCQRSLHAEVNAVAHAAKAGISLEGARIYLSGIRPLCRECQKVLTAAGVKRAE
jgi:dCMP deaminase